MSVVGQKRRIVVVLALIGFCGVAAVLRLGKLAGRGPASPPELSATHSANDKVGSLFARDPNFFSDSHSRVGTGELVVRMLVVVAIVGGLGAAAIYVSKRFLPKLTNLPGKQIRVVETTHLGPRKALHLVEVSGRRLVLGSTAEHITMLADVTYPLSEIDLSGQDRDFQVPVGSFGAHQSETSEGR
jgi:flagellar biosynthetic protein FliO